MKIRSLLVAIGLATVVAACSSHPTTPDAVRPGTAAAFDSVTTGSEGNRGGGAVGSGN